MASAGEPAHRDMASGAEPSHRHSPQDGAPRGIRRRAGARRVHDAAQDVQDVSRDVQQDAHVQKEMEARALAVLVAGLEHPDSLPAPALQRCKRQRRSRVTSRGAGQGAAGAQGPQSSRSTSAAASSSASSRGSFSHLSHSSLQSLVDRHESSQVGSDDQNHPHSSRAAVTVASSATCQGSFSSLHSLVNNCADESDGCSLRSSLVDRMDRVLKERDVGKSELERRGSEFLGIQTKEMMVLVAIVMFPPVALLAALAALLYLV